MEQIWKCTNTFHIVDEVIKKPKKVSENIFQEILQNTALHNITKHKEGFNMFAASLYIYTDKVKHGGYLGGGAYYA